MNWRQRVASWIAPPPPPERIIEHHVERPVRESINARAGDAEWRSLYHTDRDLTPLQHDRHLEVARNLATTHPVAKRALEIHADMVIADGVEIRATAKDPAVAERVQAVVDEFCEVNALDSLFPQTALEASVSGEVYLAPFVRPVDGRVKLGLLLAENVDRVTLAPYNALKRDCLVLKTWAVQDARDAGAPEKPDWKIMHRGNGGRWSGEVFALQINSLPASTRGFSDLLPVADWLDRYHQALHSEMDRARFMKTFVWDVTLTDATEGQIQDWRKSHTTAPRPGTVLVHNDAEKWEAVSPTLGSAEALELVQAIFKLILGCLGVPIHYYVSAEDVNRASAREMSDPVMAKVRRRQETLRDFWRGMVEYAIQCAREAGRLQGVRDEDLGVECVVREPDRRQLEGAGKALLDAVSAYSRAQMAGYITAEEAGTAFRDKCRAFGDEFTEEARAPVDPAAVQSLVGLPAPSAAPVTASKPVAEQLGAKVSSLWGRGNAAPPAA